MSTTKKLSTTRPQRGTPSPGSLTQPVGTNNRVSPRRATPTSSTSKQSMNTTSSNHRRGGSGGSGPTGPTRNRSAISGSTKQNSKEFEEDDFLNASTNFPSDLADQEVQSIYLESLKDPKERDRILSLVNQQKIESGFGVKPNKKNSNQNKSSSYFVSDLESNVSDTSDAATEVISYTNGSNHRPPSKSSNRSAPAPVVSGHSRQATISVDHGDATAMISPRPGVQRAIFEMATQMPSDDLGEMIELLMQLKSNLDGQPSPHSNYVSALPQGYSINHPAAPTPSGPSSSSGHLPSQKHTVPSPQGRRGKSGPPALQSSNYIISEEDEEVTQHTKHNETYRLIPPLGSSISSSMSTLLHSTTPSTLPGAHQSSSKYYRSGSATSNASGTNSTSNSRSSTPLFKRSPVPISLQHDICPTVNRDSNLSSQRSGTGDGTTPTSMKTQQHVAPPEVPNIVLPKSKRVDVGISSGSRQKKSSTSASAASSSAKDNASDGRSALLDSLHSPRSAFDDRSLSSSSSNFTSASNRSGRSRGSSTVKGPSSTNSRKH